MYKQTYVDLFAKDDSVVITAKPGSGSQCL